jgi:hypothetical protein
VLPVALAALVYATGAGAQGAFMPARSGEAGLLDVPDGEVMGVGRGLLGVELRFDQAKGVESDFGPLPLYAVGGLLDHLDFGLTMREGGQPGDAHPSRLVYGGALKLQLVQAHDLWPALAVDFTGDRLNRAEVLGGRFIASTRADRPIRLSAFVGGESGESPGVTWGGALAFRVARSAEAVLEALGGPRGQNYGAAVLWRAAPTMGVLLGANWFPGDEGFRISVGLGFGPQVKREAAPGPTPTAAPIAPSAEELAGPIFRDDQPHFRLKLRIADPSGVEPRSLRHGPWTPSGAAAGPARPVASALRPSAPSLDELAEAQIREQEALADARDRRVRATAEQLDAREKAALEEARRLEEREGELAAREQQLEAREKRVTVKGPPTQQQRQLESLEAQLASQERNLGAQERSYGPAIDAAQGRERDAAAREDAERQEANRLAASVSGAASRALQLEIRKQALGARNRQLSALEARLVAKGERIDALERQLRTRAERLDAWQRRLDAQADRIDLLERRAAEAKAGSAGPARPADGKAGAPKEKAVFVMVVKSPTAIVKERAAAPAAAAPGAALHPGVVVEKAVAAATVVMFASPAAQLSELDREAIDNIAKLAAREKCELLIWARAKDPGLMAEAQRRAAEIRSHVIASGPLDSKQVVTRITTRPGAQAVDVVVSALRETAKAAAPAAAAPATPALLAGETGKRQIREAVQAAQPSIEACVGEIVSQKSLQRAEGVLKLTVSAQGRVTKVLAAEGDLSGTALEECLGGASRNWLFPPAEAEYVVDVPITVIRGGAR